MRLTTSSFIDDAQAEVKARHFNVLLENSQFSTIADLEDIVDENMALGIYDDEINDIVMEKERKQAREYDGESRYIMRCHSRGE